MPAIDYMGIENEKHGVCGFTSALYAVYMNRPELQLRLAKALGGTSRSTRIMAEIKTFLMMMKAEKNAHILGEITAFNRQTLCKSHWHIESLINTINNTYNIPDIPPYDIGLPPEALILYMQRVWGIRSLLFEKKMVGEAILGLTSLGGSGDYSKARNKWKNLAHYVYQDWNGRLYSWGKQFASFSELCKYEKEKFSVVYCIMIHGGCWTSSVKHGQSTLRRRRTVNGYRLIDSDK